MNGRVPFMISQSFQHLNNVILLFNKQLSTREVDREILRLRNRVFEVICLKAKEKEKETWELVNVNNGKGEDDERLARVFVLLGGWILPRGPVSVREQQLVLGGCLRREILERQWLTLERGAESENATVLPCAHSLSHPYSKNMIPPKEIGNKGETNYSLRIQNQHRLGWLFVLNVEHCPKGKGS